MHDVVIVGAGPVGGALALAIADSDLDVIVIDARPAGVAARGDRTLALSHGARLIFERLRVWPLLAAQPGAVTAITAIDISQAGGFGVTRLSAAEQRLPALGYVVAYTALQLAIDAALAHTGIRLRHGVVAEGVAVTPAYAAVTLRGESEPLRTRLAVVADGAGTAVTGVTRERRDYQQVALTAKLWRDAPHDGVAYERFTADGPVALLPEGDHYGLVWTMTPARAEVVLALPDAEFLAALGAHIGGRVGGRGGEFKRVASRKSFPLALEFARPAVVAHVALIGNAAQSLHPIAGQGFNLGVRDAWALAQTINATPREALGDRSMLAAFGAQRRLDRFAGIGFTHALTQLFATNAAPIRWPRGLALTALDLLPPVKRAFARRMLFGFS